MSALNDLKIAVSNFESDFHSISSDEEKLMKVRDNFIKKTQHIVAEKSRLKKNNPLSEVTKEASNRVTSMIANWAMDWDGTKVSRDLSEEFGDKVILLVFGKVNAGKSSFSNFVASVFPEGHRRYFYLENGEINDTHETFSEGVTETTARIQGVELGGKLILLDSPGLHSVTDENGDLTRRFTDSADAVLWLTPSTSPGQVQELDDLKIELESGKPLLPIITRSDYLDEDCDEAGDLISKIYNKSIENRTLQENDVHERAKSKLGESIVVKQPTSISVHSYKDSSKSDDDLVESGLSEVLICISELIQLASNYKPRKARQQIINYLDRSVLGTIKSELIPMVMKLDETIDNQDKLITQRQNEVLLSLNEELTEKVTDWAEELKDRNDSKAELTARINDLITTRLTKELSSLVENYTDEVSTVADSFSQDDTGDFENIYVNYEEVTGGAWRAAGGAGGAVGGAALGTAILPGLGTVVGGLIGGLVGSAAGNYMVETTTKSEQIGVDTSNVIEVTLIKLDQKLPNIIQKVFNVWKIAITHSKQNIKLIRKEIEIFEQSLNNSKESLVNECR